MKKAYARIAALGLSLSLLSSFAPAYALDVSTAMAGMTGGASAGGTTGSESTVVSATAVSGGSGFGGGGSGEESRVVSHARSTTDDTTPYGALALTVENAPALELKVGGAALDLAFQGPNEAALPFAPALAHLEPSPASGEESPESTGVNALVLTPSEESAAGQWRFSGTVLRKLVSSGVNLLAFQSGEKLAVLPTDGFLAGYRYDRWRSSGVANQQIRYTLAFDGSTLSLTAQANGESFPVSPEEDGMLYSVGINSYESSVIDFE